MIPFRDDVPARRYPVMTVLIILVNVVVFAYELAVPDRHLEQMILDYGVIPARLMAADGDSLPAFSQSLLTSMFLHGSLFHLLSNMWFLWIFGDNVEDRMGATRFLFFYLLCGVLAGGAHIVFNIDSSLPTIGASGAVAGVLGAYMVSYPYARILTLIPLLIIWPIVELPALVVLGYWLLIQILSGAMSLTGTAAGGVAWWAHVGGFVVGMLLVRAFAQPIVRRYYVSD